MLMFLNRLICVGAAVACAPVFAQQAAQLLTQFNEQIVSVPAGTFSVQLETTIFKPPGDGPFPLMLFNHGKAFGNPLFQARSRPIQFATEMVRRGYVVMLPNRKGVSKSGGTYIGNGCNVAGIGNAQADDVAAALDYAAKLPYVDKTRMVVGGQSHGGMTTIAFGARAPYPGVLGLLNFAGGSRNNDCVGWQRDNAAAFGKWGETARLPSLWFYGENDSFFDYSVSKPSFDAFVKAGGRGRMVDFGRFEPGDAHGMHAHASGVAIWWPELKTFLEELGLPTAVVYNPSAVTIPPRTNFAAVNDVERVPYLKGTALETYRTFLGMPATRAVAIAPNGRMGWAHAGIDPAQRAMEFCQKDHSEPCKLYAVNDDVVWANP